MFALLLGNERFGWSRPISEVARVSPVKPSAQPTQVRTLHLPRKTPGQTRCPVFPAAGSSACPGAVRADRWLLLWASRGPDFGRSAACEGVALSCGPGAGQLGSPGWLASYLCRSGAMSSVAGWCVVSGGVQLGPAVTRTHGGRVRTPRTVVLGASRGPCAPDPGLR
jgi:hypothetical protein